MWGPYYGIFLVEAQKIKEKEKEKDKEKEKEIVSSANRPVRK